MRLETLVNQRLREVSNFKAIWLQTSSTYFTRIDYNNSMLEIELNYNFIYLTYINLNLNLYLYNLIFRK